MRSVRHLCTSDVETRPDETGVPELVLLFRDGCHLCEDMALLLQELLEPGSFTLTRVDIDENPELREIHDTRVPVLLLAGVELCHHFLDLQAVRAGLASYTCRALSAD